MDLPRNFARVFGLLAISPCPEAIKAISIAELRPFPLQQIIELLRQEVEVQSHNQYTLRRALPQLAQDPALNILAVVPATTPEGIVCEVLATMRLFAINLNSYASSPGCYHVQTVGIQELAVRIIQIEEQVHMAKHDCPTINAPH